MQCALNSELRISLAVTESVLDLLELLNWHTSIGLFISGGASIHTLVSTQLREGAQPRIRRQPLVDKLLHAVALRLTGHDISLRVDVETV